MSEQNERFYFTISHCGPASDASSFLGKEEVQERVALQLGHWNHDVQPSNPELLSNAVPAFWKLSVVIVMRPASVAYSFNEQLNYSVAPEILVKAAIRTLTVSLFLCVIFIQTATTVNAWF